MNDFFDGKVDVDVSTVSGRLVDEDNAVSKGSIDISTMSVPYTSVDSVNMPADLLFPNNMGSRAETTSLITPSPIYQEHSSQVSSDNLHETVVGENESAVLDHVLEVVSLNSHFCAPITTILLGDSEHDLFRKLMPHNFENYSEMVASFTRELRQLFMVPNLLLHNNLSDNDHENDTLKKSELVAAFIAFLLQLLSHGKGLVFSIEDMIHNLKKELKSLVIVLGDTSLLGAAEIEQVKTLLEEFEAVANEAEAAAVDSSSIIVYVLRDLEELMHQEDDLIVHMKGQLKIVHQRLVLSQSFLKDIEVLQLSEMEEELKQVVMIIRDVAYEAEYLINSFLVKDAPLWYLIIKIPNVIHKNKLIGTGLQEIKKKYDIEALKLTKDFSPQLSLQAKRNSDVEDVIVGFEDKTTDILDLLTGGSDHLQIITIFGMPGLGKTTLAKKLYTHASVNYYFDKLSWCTISQAYRRRSVLSDILATTESQLDSAIIRSMADERLAERIYKSLKGRRYLIVMDDIWHSDVWDDLRRCFPDDGNGSRILFTSRNRDVAPPNSIIHELTTLSNEQCWELLQKKVFGNGTCPPQLLDIGVQIAASCRGLPLAVVVVAEILSTMDRDKSKWENVGGSLASFILADQNNSTMQILELSYKHLPDHLKPCFLYFAAFPNVKEIPVRNLKWLWIAEAFICKEEKKSLESVAEEYLMELIGKSLVTVNGRRSDGGVKSCVIHDLLRDLCLRRAEEQNFMKLVVNNYSIYGKHRCLYAPTYSPFMNRTYKASHVLSEHYCLGSPLSVRSFLGYHPGSPLNVLNMELLKVLDCRDLDGIEMLVHLRYLAIDPMPSSIGRLVNLEFLLVHNNVSISPSILKMTKLRYLRANEAIFDKDCDSSQIVINNLEYLSTVCIFNLKDEEMIKCSPHLRRLKCNCKPLLINDEGTSYRYPDLRFLTQLESLKMTTVYGDAIAADFNLPSNIKKLTLSGLRLHWEKMSIIGTLPNLKVLKLEAGAFCRKIWETRDGEFQQLRFLKLEKLSIYKWKVKSREHFPKLYQLVLHNCEYLKKIPSEIGEIPTLHMIEVKSCTKSVEESAVQMQEEQRDMGNEDLRVVIYSELHFSFSYPVLS
ncbi:hypothetical protein BUALT_Bualt02G0066100 [Buddleja alternifolia]|uniref:Late blight resistance protein n=1 Tax=Buddleja alternifolia TaxID=168488 RepID=A0AAV6XYH7_9LAMI|nr:hypothetical protein BUALT_Bualt02G0066100 [Buddleja alternifolia]